MEIETKYINIGNMKQKLFFLLLSLIVSSLAIGQTKTRIVDKKDGFIWYKLKRGNYYGAQDINGKIIIPIKYDDVEYETYGKGDHFFKVKKGDFKGAYTRKGTLVIPTERNYTSIWAAVGNEKMCFIVSSNGKRTGVCDLRGKEVIPPIYETIGFEAVTVFTPRTHYYHSDIHYFYINRNGKWGICNMDGDIVVQPTSGHYPLLSRSEYEHDKKDGIYDSDSKITNINLTADTRFDYTPYDDLYYSYSYPSESSNSSSSSSSSSSISQKGSDVQAFDLKGRVKSCEWIGRDRDNGLKPLNNKAEFDKNGKLVTNATIKRNNKGQIELISSGKKSISYAYNDNGSIGAVVYDYGVSEGGISPCTGILFVYNSQGRIEKAYYKNGLSNIHLALTMTDVDETINYEYVEYDNNGNWTKRQYKKMDFDFFMDYTEVTYEEERIISYY